MSDFDTNDLEKTSLEAHVGLCSMRFKALDQRLTKVEQKLEKIEEDIKTGNSSLVKVIVGTAGTIITGIVSVIIVLLTKF